MKQLTPEEKEALKEKIHEAGLDQRGRTIKLTLSDDKKEEMKKMIARAEHDRLGQLDKQLHSRSKRKKKSSEEEISE